MKPISHNLHSSFEQIYDTYSSMLYGVALEISPDKNKAEDILFRTFIKINEQKSEIQQRSSMCLALMKLLIETANEDPEIKKNNYSLKQFENSPLLTTLLIKCTTLENVCKQNNITRMQAARKLREEITLLRDKKGLEFSHPRTNVN